jgi:hypothetical protein
MAVYIFLLPDTERVTAAFSAVLHCGTAVALAAGIREHQPVNPVRGT